MARRSASARRRRAAVAVALTGGLALPAATAPAAVPPPGPPTVTLASVGAWCWFADPRAIAHGGRVVFGWVADDGSIMAGDDRGRQVALDPRLERDDHDNPAFYVRRDGRLMAFWSAHNGRELRYRMAAAGVGSSWGPVGRAPANPGGGDDRYTYPNPLRVGTTLYLFWSGTATTATYATSPDDGDRWSAARTLFAATGPRVRYVKYRAAADGIHLAWSLGHPREGASGIRHAVIRGGSVERQDGTPIGRLGTPLDPTAGDLVYAPTVAGGAWIHDLAVVDGRPEIAYAAFPSATDHRYRVATWDGRRWRDEQVAAAGPSFELSGAEPSYSGGIVLDPARAGVAYLSRRSGSAVHELARAERTADGWTLTAITSDSAQPNVRPYPVAGGLAWMRGAYPGYTRFRTALVWRPGAQAPPPAATAVRVVDRRLPRDRRLRAIVHGPGGPLRVRVVRPTADGRLAIAGEVAGRAHGGRLTVRLPRLRAGLYRVSVWRGDQRLGWRHVRVAGAR
ncbi:BNR-4 repeat-containing protein [Patulibacter defluvii]|uniref:BNR-4 repeat-containing protein n=1 Tax=Patulibacter defluvii TaxID=3095358 RepID=UPI002A75F752|nr:BNR-4 repeat-containing protein [Patulibacter sp. DM4]